MEYYIIVLLFVLLVLLQLNNQQIFNNKENFSLGYGRSFSQFYQPYPKCTFDNNCFAGSYFNQSEYVNLCEPKKGLLKQKLNLVDTRIKKL